jgi:hypothetical protein
MDPDALARFEREAMSPSVPDIEIRARRQDQFAHGAEHLGSLRRYGRGCRGPGDVAMLEQELTRVLKALCKSGTEIVAIHHHMAAVQPMVVFLHYWGKGEAAALARGVRGAVDEFGKRPPEGRSSTDVKRSAGSGDEEASRHLLSICRLLCG